MSRPDHDYHPPPPGLARSSMERDHHGYSHSSQVPNVFLPSERRAMPGYSMYAPLSSSNMHVPRSDHDGFVSGGVGGAGGGGDGWSSSMLPNRHTPASVHVQHFSSFNHNNQHLPYHHSPPSPPHNGNALYHSSAYIDRDAYNFRNVRHQSPPSVSSPIVAAPSVNTAAPSFNSTRSTLWWGELEPWMDEEYAKQVCGLMGWDPVNIKVPHATPDGSTGQQANNPGYCFLTFPTQAHAASVMAQINGGNGNPITMPNSSKPFVVNWASSVPTAPISAPPSFSPATVHPMPGAQQQFPKEYSIFVGDLAPETSNSDLVAVFRNPVLGLRNDREPKFIRPFVSCKSAKIMLDPVTGVSRGYGFVRFTDETDQQRALIEMHGLYCLSRPMRISPATAKFKPPPTAHVAEHPHVQFASLSNVNGMEQQPQPVTIALPISSSTQARSVSAPIAANPPATSTSPGNNNGIQASASGSGSSMNGSNSTPSLSSGSSNSISSSALVSSPDDMLNLPHSVLAQIAQQYANGTINPPKMGGAPAPAPAPAAPATVPVTTSQGQDANGLPRYLVSEESWKHHAQARAILGNLIGPNGEQLTSTDPYNTTVFVGGLSPLISEDTLRTFFAPFGDIHYVKVPVGKHCGFVQFVRKADAERAIEKMQGFPVGGSRIRLSWGRSQYKAAQAAAQAAQAAAFQTQLPPAPHAASPPTSMTPEQVFHILQKLGINIPTQLPESNTSEGTPSSGGFPSSTAAPFNEEKLRATVLAREEPIPFDSYTAALYGGQMPPATHEVRQNRGQSVSSFSPFSPDPNLYLPPDKRRDSGPFTRSTEQLPHPSKSYAPGFGPSPLHTHDSKTGVSMSESTSSSRLSPGSNRPSSASQRYGSYLESSASSSFQVNRAPGRPEAPISRPSSSSTQGRRSSGAGFEGKEQDVIQDLNGTLASLDLDQSWKPQLESSDSQDSVQFQMTMSSNSHTRTPSP